MAQGTQDGPSHLGAQGDTGPILQRHFEYILTRGLVGSTSILNVAISPLSLVSCFREIWTLIGQHLRSEKV